MNRYIIVGPARSGTTVTHLCLAGHPNVSALSDEVTVQPFFTKGIRAFTHGNDRKSEFKTGFLALFDTLCSLNKPEAELLACGLKTAISFQEEAQDFVRSVQEYFPAVQIVLTQRDDIVAQFGSLERAKATGKWHSWVKQEQDLAGQLVIDEQMLATHAVAYLRVVRELQRLKETHEVFEISYEKDILPGDMQIYNRLFRFLGLPEMEITWLSSKKVAPAPQEYIADYERHTATIAELRKRFEANPGLFTAAAASGRGKKGLFKRLLGRFLRK